MNSTTTETVIYLNFAATIFTGIIAVLTHMGWMRFQSACCKQGTCCQISEAIGTQGVAPRDVLTQSK